MMGVKTTKLFKITFVGRKTFEYFFVDYVLHFQLVGIFGFDDR